MSNPQDAHALRKKLTLSKQQQQALISDKRQLVARVQVYSKQAVSLLNAEKFQQAVAYLQQAQRLLQAAAKQGHTIDHSLAQCVLHNEAVCYQHLWNLQQCSMYIQALIYNLNSKAHHQPQTSNHARHSQHRKALAQYYLQFSAINSQLGNHSGALISAQKALSIIKADISGWQKWCQIKQHGKRSGEWQERIRLLNLASSFNDNINTHLQQTISQATSYFLKAWRSNCSSSKIVDQELKIFIDNYTIKDVMNLTHIEHSQYVALFNEPIDLTLANAFQLVFYLATAYFTIATQLRLISIKRWQQNGSQKNEQRQLKQSQIYHLFAILILAISLTTYSPFLGHLLVSYNNHFKQDLMLKQISYKKAFSQAIFKDQRNYDPHEHNHQQPLSSHLTIPSHLLRPTKSSKGHKQSLIQPKSKNKNSKKQSKSKQKHTGSSLSKQRHSKTPKESLLVKSPASKESLNSKTRIPSVRMAPSLPKIRLANNKKTITEKVPTKTNRKNKMIQPNEYFLGRKEGNGKKSSLSSKKNKSQSKSTGRLPINSTLEKDTAKDKKKTSKKSLLQHYL